MIMTEEIFLSNEAKTNTTVQAEGMSEQMSGSGKGGGRAPLSCPLQDALSHQAAYRAACQVKCRPTCLCRAALQELRSLVNVGPSRGILVFSYPLGFHLVT